MANCATISFVGTVMGEPKNRQVNGTTVLSMRVSVKTTKKDPNPEAKYNLTDLYDVSVWGRPAEYLITTIQAKTKVWVSGEFMTGEPWKDRDGKEHLSLRVKANQIEVLSGGNYNNNNSNTTGDSGEADPF